MSNLEELKLEEKEISFCMIPMNILGENDTEIEIKDNQMGVYVPKLMSSLNSEKPKNEKVNIDYSIVRNLNLTKKKIISCNYLLVEPYTENNLSPQLFTKGEKCFTKFLFKDIKRAYFTSEKLSCDIEKTQDIKAITVNSGEEQYKLLLDSVNKKIELSDSSRIISINEKEERITVSNQGTQIILEENAINIESESINFVGEIKINGIKLENLIQTIVDKTINEREEGENNDNQY